MPRVRTTMRPGQVVEVSPAEYVDLARWGVLAGDDQAPAVHDEPALPAPDETQARRRKANADG